tara:strand:- start:63 stop:461 length:399 start_codon:yes stop_codon:yes gene_type:complete
MPRKKKQETILIPAPGLSFLIAKALKRYKDCNLYSSGARKHVAEEVYHVVCEYITMVNQGIVDENPLAPEPEKRKVLSLTPEEFKEKQDGKAVKKQTVKKQPEIILKEPVKKSEQNVKRSVRRTRTPKAMER